MPLAKGDLRSVGERIVETFLADTGDGGLRDAADAPDFPVMLVTDELKGDPSWYADEELPCIVILPQDKRTGQHPTHGPKTFTYTAVVYHKGLELETIDPIVQDIADRVEEVIEEQKTAANSFGLVPGDVIGYNSRGGITVSTPRTVMVREPEDDDKSETMGLMTSRAIVNFSLEVPIFRDPC